MSQMNLFKSAVCMFEKSAEMYDWENWVVLKDTECCKNNIRMVNLNKILTNLGSLALISCIWFRFIGIKKSQLLHRNCKLKSLKASFNVKP